MASAMGDPDAVAVGDYHLKNLVVHALAGEPRGTDERMLELLAPYAGQRGRVIRLLLARWAQATGSSVHVNASCRWHVGDTAASVSFTCGRQGPSINND